MIDLGFLTGRLPMTNFDIFYRFKIDRHAFRYFGILRFTDMPGYFPQLSAPRP